MKVYHRHMVLATVLLTGSLTVTPVVAGDDRTDEEGLCAPQAYAMGLRYQQRSGEVAALQRQAYALATLRLKEAIAAHDGDEPPLAIITDLDETVLDNSALLARDMAACHDYTSWDTWSHWEREGTPQLIPGAREFLDLADAQGVAIYYLSDRTQENEADTIATLETLELPQVSEESVMLLGPPKAERRAIVNGLYTLVMQLGDTLHDFDGEFADANLSGQRERVEENAARFGVDWIVFPNAAYGDWSEAELDAWDVPLQVE